MMITDNILCKCTCLFIIALICFCAFDFLLLYACNYFCNPKGGSNHTGSFSTLQQQVNMATGASAL